MKLGKEGTYNRCAGELKGCGTEQKISQGQISNLTFFHKEVPQYL